MNAVKNLPFMFGVVIGLGQNTEILKGDRSRTYLTQRVSGIRMQVSNAVYRRSLCGYMDEGSVPGHGLGACGWVQAENCTD